MAIRIGIRKSTSIIAIGGFIALNVIIGSLYQSGKEIAGSTSTHTSPALKNLVRHLDASDEVSIESTVSGFNQLQQPPTVLLMGSSLMMYPMFAVDKGVEPRLCDGILQYHRADALQRDLRQAGLSQARVYNFATPLQMVSDTYLYANKYLQGKAAPEVLVLGIAPRDFSDSEFPLPGNTLNFSDQVSVLSVAKYAANYLPGWQNQLDFALRRSLIFWDKRYYVQRFFDDKLAGSREIPKMALGTQFAFGLDKYKMHYRGISVSQLHTQMDFLAQLCQLCHDRQIKLIVVNMPLPLVNRQLLPAGFYDSYRQELHGVLAAQSSSYIDLASSQDFASDYVFCDAAHMNQYGGKALVNDLVTEIMSVSHQPTRSVASASKAAL